MNTKTKKSINETTELARNYLETRYEDSFTPVRFSGETWAYNYATVVFTSAKFGREVEVLVKEEENGLVLSDTYFRLLFEKDALEYAASAAGDRFAVKVQFPVYMTSTDILDAQSFGDYVENGLRFDAYFLTKEEFYDGDITKVTTALGEHGFTGTAEFILVKDENGEPSIDTCSLADIYGRFLLKRVQIGMKQGRIE